jgi:hypothetical protein
MTDLEIITLIEDKNLLTVQNMETLMGGFCKSMSTLITTETQDIRHSINELTKRVEKQNGSVRELNEWKARHEGVEEGKDESHEKDVRKKAEKRADHQKTLQLIATTIMALGLVLTAVFGFLGNENSKDNGRKIENLGDPVVTNPRGEYVPLPEGYSLKMYPRDFDSNYTDTLK